MLVQSATTSVPGTSLHCRQAAMRGKGFAVSLLCSSGIATDWGVQSRIVEYIARQRRSQLSLVLRGRGYVVGASGAVLLGEGDVVELDQRRHDEEGYGGSPCEVLVVEWDEEGPFGPERPGPPRVSRLAPRDVERLRALSASMTTTPSETWMEELVRVLRASGLPAPREPRRHAAVPVHLRKLYASIGTTRAQLNTMPSIVEVAEQLGVSERQVRRGLVQLESDFGMTNRGWRDMLGDLRMGWAQQLLSVPGMSMKRVSELAGYRSPVALSHAFSQRSGMTPGAVAVTLRERWR